MNRNNGVDNMFSSNHVKGKNRGAFGTKAIVAGVAIWVASQAGIAILDLLGRVNDALSAAL